MGIVRISRYAASTGSPTGRSAPHVDAFKQHLTDRGYAATTFASYLGGIAHFAQWIRGQRLRVARIDEASIAEFLDEHLPRLPMRGAGPPRPARPQRSAGASARRAACSGCHRRRRR